MAKVVLTASDTSYTVASGNNAELIGLSDAQTITIQAGATANLTGDFTGDNIVLPGNAGNWTMVRSGATVTLIDSSTGTTVQVAASTVATTLTFDDGARDLAIDSEAGTVNLGTEAVTETESTVGATDPASYTLTAGAESVDEGTTATFTLATTNVAEGTEVAYTISGVEAADVDGGALTGTAIVDADGNATISVALAADLATEGAETLTVSIDGQTATASSTVNDTSTATTYTVTADSASVTEGGTVTFTVSVNNPSDTDTVLNYQFAGVEVAGGTATPASDLTDVTGTVTIAAGQTSATFTASPLDDGTTEGFEGFNVTVLDSSFNTVATSDNVVIQDGATAGQNFSLTTSADNLTGTTGDDTFIAVLDGGAAAAANTTLSASDQINGGAGTEDTLKITLQSTVVNPVPSASVTNVENIEIRNVSSAATVVAGNGFIGATEFISDRSTQQITFNDIGIADLTIKGDNTVGNGAVVFNAASNGSSVTDALTINVMDGVEQGNITSNDANDDWTAVTINSTGGTATSTAAANVVGALDLAGGDTMQSLTVNATTSFTATSVAGWDTTGATTANKGTITITGAGAVNIGTLDAAVETVNASSNSGGVTLTANTQTDAVFTGSSGNDRFTTGAVLVTDGGADAGAGTDDRLIVADSTHVTETVGLEYSNFESLQVSHGVTVDMDHLSTNNTITSVRFTDGGVVNDMNATQAAAVTVTTGGNNPTFGVKGSTTVGQIDTLKITADDGASTVSTVALGTPVMTGVEKLELTATDAITITALTSATSVDSIVITGAQTVGITSGAITPNVNTVVDGSAATGALTLDFSGITASDTNAISFIGSSAGDTITTSGATDDLVNGKGGIDSITITKDGGGETKYADVQSEATASADADLITGFVSTENDFDYNGTLVNGTGAGAGIASTEVASATTIAAALATGDAANDIVFIATTDLTGAQETALDAAVAGGMTAAEATAVEAALVATGGALNGAIANLDSVLGASDSVLFQFSTDTDTMVLRITNSDTSTANTLTAAEVELIGVFAATVDLVAADYV